jgi:hypothetical protein
MKAPELTGFWFDDDGPVAASRVADDTERSEQEALDDLADRVSAARSVY